MNQQIRKAAQIDNKKCKNCRKFLYHARQENKKENSY